MDDPDLAFARLNRDQDDRFQSLRRELGASAVGLNMIVLQPGQRGRIHAHAHQEEIFLVLEGELTLVVESVDHRVAPDGLVRVPPAARRQLANAGGDRLVLLAIGAAGDHVGRDAVAWTGWDDDGPGRPPQETPLPEDLPGAG